MHTGVRRSQQINQKKLKGSPRTLGSTRSHSATGKQMAAKGISPRRMDPSDGLFKSLLVITCGKWVVLQKQSPVILPNSHLQKRLGKAFATSRRPQCLCKESD